MKSNSFKWVQLLYGVALMFTACDSDFFQDVIELEKTSFNEKVTEVSQYTTQVTVDDAKRLADLFNAGKVQTKAGERTVGDVTTLTDAEGTPLIYVINYADNQGFVLVSATRNYYPVLAYNDQGNFKLFDTDLPDALEDWIADKKKDISCADSLPKDSTYQFRTEWEKYETGRTTFIPQAGTRSTANSALDSYVMSMLSQWDQEGIEYYSLDQAENILPGDLYSTWCGYAEVGIWPSYGDYMTYSFVVVSYDDSGSQRKKNPFQPAWQQEDGFNDALTPIDDKLPPAGCCAIAMAQVLRHYEYPFHYNWSEMPYTIATSTTASFIKEVADNINSNYSIGGTSSTLANIQASLVNDYYYSSSIELIDHSFGRTVTEIDNERPVIMRGASSPTAAGHAWVVSGYDILAGHTEYRLWVPTGNIEEVADPYDMVATYSDNYYTYNSIYIHWGWKPDYNGYFMDSNVWIRLENGEERFYNSNRKDLVNIFY